jgi:hypothetical protein
MKDNKDTFAKLELEVRKALGLVPATPTPVAATPTNGAAPATSKVATMPTGTDAKVPAARR